MRATAAALIALVPAVLHAQTPGAVVFSEIMWMGSSLSSADEWIELANRSAHEVDLTGWVITRTSADSERVMVTLPPGSLAPNHTFLIANYAADNAKCALGVTPDLVDPAVALVNSKLLLRLYDGDPQAGGRLIDQADDGKGAPLAGDAKLKASMVRVQLDADGSDASSWATATRATGWEPGASEWGTPGSLPSPDASAEPPPSPATDTAVRSASWGALKLQPSLR